MKKSYAQSVLPQAGVTDTSSTPPEWSWPAGGYNRPPTPEPPPWPPTETEQLPSAGSVQTDGKLVADLTALQVAIKALPMSTETDEVRAIMLAKEMDLKARLLTSRPLGTQLDGVQGAISRAQKRLNAAKETLESARQVIAAEEASLQELNQQKADIEHRISAERQQPQGVAQTPLKEQLQGMAHAMQTGPVPPAELATVQQQLTELLAAIQRQQAAQPPTAAAPAAAPTAVPAEAAVSGTRCHSTPERDAPARSRLRTETVDAGSEAAPSITGNDPAGFSGG